MNCLDRFNQKMKRGGGSLRNEKINSSIALLNNTFKDDTSFTDDIYFWKLGLKDYENETPIPMRIYEKTYSVANGYRIKFQTLNNNPIYVGDIIYILKYDEYYICTESFDINGIHYQGRFTLCNWMLKWQNKQGVILEYPCYNINATQYNSGETGGRIITVANSQHLLYLPADENTIILNTPQRFFLDKNTKNPTSYIITQNDTTSYNIGKNGGMIRLTTVEHPTDYSTDNIELGICDYISEEEIKKDNKTISRVAKSVISYDTNVIKSGGSPQTFIGKFYDDKGNEITSIVTKWTILCDFFDSLEIEEIGNEISISIDDDTYIDEQIKLVLSDSIGDFMSYIFITIDSLM